MWYASLLQMINSELPFQIKIVRSVEHGLLQRKYMMTGQVHVDRIVELGRTIHIFVRGC
jgi:hypothetical protein